MPVILRFNFSRLIFIINRCILFRYYRHWIKAGWSAEQLNSAAN